MEAQTETQIHEFATLLREFMAYVGAVIKQNDPDEFARVMQSVDICVGARVIPIAMDLTARDVLAMDAVYAAINDLGDFADRVSVAYVCASLDISDTRRLEIASLRARIIDARFDCASTYDAYLREVAYSYEARSSDALAERDAILRAMSERMVNDEKPAGRLSARIARQMQRTAAQRPINVEPDTFANFTRARDIALSPDIRMRQIDRDVPFDDQYYVAMPNNIAAARRMFIRGARDATIFAPIRKFLADHGCIARDGATSESSEAREWTEFIAYMQAQAQRNAGAPLIVVNRISRARVIMNSAHLYDPDYMRKHDAVHITTDKGLTDEFIRMYTTMAIYGHKPELTREYEKGAPIRVINEENLEIAERIAIVEVYSSDAARVIVCATDEACAYARNMVTRGQSTRASFYCARVNDAILAGRSQAITAQVQRYESRGTSREMAQVFASTAMRIELALLKSQTRIIQALRERDRDSTIFALCESAFLAGAGSTASAYHLSQFLAIIDVASEIEKHLRKRVSNSSSGASPPALPHAEYTNIVKEIIAQMQAAGSFAVFDISLYDFVKEAKR